MKTLTAFEKDLLLQYLTHIMTQETRHALMRFLPVQYNKLVGFDVMRVEKVES